MNFNTKNYREFCSNVLGRCIEHNEIDQNNLTTSEHTLIMNDTQKFREAYFQCFSHYPIESIWPDFTSEGIEEPDSFININLMNVFLTKLKVKNLNKNARKSELRDKYNRSIAKRNKFSIIPKFLNKILRKGKVKSEEEFKQEFDLQFSEIENCSDYSICQKLDPDKIPINTNSLKLNAKLANKVSNNKAPIFKQQKELEEVKNQFSHPNSEEIKTNQNELNINDPHGLMFLRLSSFSPSDFCTPQFNVINDLKIPFLNCEPVSTVDSIVYYQQINFCGDKLNDDDDDSPCSNIMDNWF